MIANDWTRLIEWIDCIGTHLLSQQIHQHRLLLLDDERQGYWGGRPFCLAGKCEKINLQSYLVFRV